MQYDPFKDSRGFIWVGTDGGVSKWDGVSFKNYNTLDGLAGNKVWCIDEDGQGNMWFACYGGGLSVFNGHKFISYTEKEGLVENTVRQVKYSKRLDAILIGCSNAISILKDATFYNFTIQNGDIPQNIIITGVLSDSLNDLFLSFSGAHQKAYLNKINEPEISKLDHSWLNNYEMSSGFVLSENDTVIGWSRSGIVRKNEDGIQEFDSIGQVFGIAKDFTDRLWVASWNGGNLSPPGGLFTIDDKQVTKVNKQYNIQTILGWITFSEEEQHQILYGTLDKGLYRIPPQYFEYYPPSYFNESELAVKDIEFDNDLWLISDDLLIIKEDNTHQKISIDSFTNSKINRTRNQEGKKNNKKGIKNFNTLEFDHDNNARVTIDLIGLIHLEKLNIKESSYLIANIGNQIKYDESDSLFHSHTWSHNIRKYENIEENTNHIICSDSLDSVFCKKLFSFKNEIWAIGRIENVYFQKDGLFLNLNKEDSTINKVINDICFDKNGYAYIGGSDGRVEVLAPETRKKVFEIEHRGNSNSVQWLQSTKNRLFVGYSDGLRVYLLDEIYESKVKYQYYGQSEGYKAANVFNSQLDKNGDIWLGTGHGLVKLNTVYFEMNKLHPLKTIIQKAELFNKPIDWKDFSPINIWTKLPSETPILEFDQNHVSIYFHTINYSNTSYDEYYYKLEKVDKEWFGPSDKKYVVFPNLRSGKYNFQVKSKNKLSGLFSETAEFSFVILKPWYQQIWFYGLVTFSIIGLLFFLYKGRINKMKKEDQRKRDVFEKISELESKALQAQMNPHFLFNSLNSIQSFILKNNVDDALTYLNSFSRVIRMTLEFANKKFISISDELEYLEHYTSLENMRFDDLFVFKVNYTHEIDIESMKIPPMLTQIIIENAIKHGFIRLNKSGIIHFTIELIDDISYRCIIEDNGMGRAASAKLNKDKSSYHQSKGLGLVEDRIKNLNKNDESLFRMDIIDLYDNVGIASGTKVVLTLPYVL